MIKISIDLTLLDKAKFTRKVKKNGKEAVYCELCLFETPDNQYGNDYLVKQGSTQEERAAGQDMPILGNGKKFGRQAGTPSGGPSAKHTAPAEPAAPPNDDDVPF